MLIPILSSCAATDRERYRAASIAKAQTEAAAPRYLVPDDCRTTEAHAPLVVGTETVSVLARERAALDRQNARTLRCADHAQGVFDHLAAD